MTPVRVFQLLKKKKKKTKKSKKKKKSHNRYHTLYSLKKRERGHERTKDKSTTEKNKSKRK